MPMPLSPPGNKRRVVRRKIDREVAGVGVPAICHQLGNFIDDFVLVQPTAEMFDYIVIELKDRLFCGLGGFGYTLYFPKTVQRAWSDLLPSEFRIPRRSKRATEPWTIGLLSAGPYRHYQQSSAPNIGGCFLAPALLWRSHGRAKSSHARKSLCDAWEKPDQACREGPSDAIEIDNLIDEPSSAPTAQASCRGP
jgi:hypothetical protein